jgi:hypothetical protein
MVSRFDRNVKLLIHNHKNLGRPAHAHWAAAIQAVSFVSDDAFHA